jgi:hypothetical protein
MTHMISSLEKTFISQLLNEFNDEISIQKTMDSIESFIADKPFSSDPLDEKIYYLGEISFLQNISTNERSGGDFTVIGRRLWENYRNQIYEVLCGESTEYAEERKKLHTITENSLIVLIPLLMSALNIPTAATGVGVVLSLLVLKIGLKTMCATRGDLLKLRGKPGNICLASGTYINILAGTRENIFKGKRFPEGPQNSEWIFFDELP